MADFEAHSLTDQAVLIGLITNAQAREAQDAAEDGTLEALTRSLLRKQFLTSWQVDKLLKGSTNGFFYGGCKILFHIAEGTFARVYRGQKPPKNRSVAVKVLRQRFVADHGAVERFNKEAEAGLKLIHPNIVRIQDFGEQDNQHYMIMEYVEGSNLRDFLKIRVRLTTAEALPLMLGLAKGLQYSIEQGVTHRDIKATNILISHSGVAKLVDFGLATIEGDEKKMAAAHGLRTVDYSALERTCLSPKGDPRSDIFFLGCVFYHMIAGVAPMQEAESKDPLAKMLKRSFSAIKPLSEHRNPPPPGITRIIEKMMKMDLKLRYQSMAEVVKDLEEYEVEAENVPIQKSLKPTGTVRKPAAIKKSEDPFEDDDLFEPDLFEVKAAASKSVLCVEAQPAIQDVFRKTLARMGYRVMLVGDAERAAERFRESQADVVVFDLDGLGPDALESFLDMHEKAHEDGHDLAAVVLLGPRQGGLSQKMPDDDRLVVLTKPIKMKDVQDALTLLVPVG